MTVSNFLTLLLGINIHMWDCSSFVSRKLLLFLHFYWRSGTGYFQEKDNLHLRRIMSQLLGRSGSLKKTFITTGRWEAAAEPNHGPALSNSVSCTHSDI